MIKTINWSSIDLKGKTTDSKVVCPACSPDRKQERQKLKRKH